MRPKMPAMRTVSAESSPCSGDSLTTSTGTWAVPMVSSRICGQRALAGSDPHDDRDHGHGQPGADEDGGDERPRLRAQLQCTEHGRRHLPSRRRASIS